MDPKCTGKSSSYFQSSQKLNVKLDCIITLQFKELVMKASGLGDKRY